MCKENTYERKTAHRVLVYLLSAGLEMVDLVNDWLLYIDLSISEQGLVYGPPEPAALTAMLVFAIIGTLLFVLEIANLTRDTFCGDPWVDVDLVSAISLWAEDVPQITINVVIAFCREDPASVFQLSKASITVLAVIIRIITSLVRYCSREKLKEAEKNSRSTASRVFIMLGLFYTFACGIAIFVFTQTQKHESGNIYFQVPTSIFEDRYNDERYFKNVSVYFHHETFNYVRKSNKGSNWMRLISMKSVINLPAKRVYFNYEFQNDTTELRMVLRENNNGTWVAQECYIINKTSGVISPGSTNMANCDTFLKSGPNTNIFFHFKFRSPERIFRRLIFGDIVYNAMINNGSRCSTMSEIRESSRGLATTVPVIHYYRTNESESGHLLQTPGGAVQFYDNLANLRDIEEVWRTGWGNCPSSGSLAPHIKEGISAPCKQE